jgi:diguanylate cyclase (GGDEF)-like protein/PAS domain S-box-containing protein
MTAEIQVVVATGALGAVAAACAATVGWARRALRRAAAREAEMAAALREAAAREAEMEAALRDAEARYQALAATAVESVVTMDAAGVIVYANPAAERLFRYGADELIGRQGTALLPEFLRRVHGDELARYLRTGTRSVAWQGVRTLALDREGHEIPVEVSVSERRHGEARLFTAVARNLSSPRLVEKRLQADRRRIEALSEISRIALEDLEYRPMLQRICDTLARAFGWELVTFVSIIAERHCFVCEAITAAAPTAVHAGFELDLGRGVVGRVAATGLPILLDDVRTCPDYIDSLPGVRSELCVPIVHKGSLFAALNVESTRLAAFHREQPFLMRVADQVAGALAGARLYEEVRERASLALVDGLTGIANRRQLDDVLDREWRRGSRSRSPLSLVLVDIDSFKPFNDLYGHPAGDECLRQVAAALADVPRRAGDLVARYGGEEFAMVLPDVDAEGALRVAEAARCRIEALAIQHGAATAAPVVTISAGAATRFPSHGGSARLLVAAADRALYLAKRKGGNRIQAAGRGRTARSARPRIAGRPHENQS